MGMSHSGLETAILLHSSLQNYSGCQVAQGSGVSSPFQVQSQILYWTEVCSAGQVTFYMHQISSLYPILNPYPTRAILALRGEPSECWHFPIVALTLQYIVKNIRKNLLLKWSFFNDKLLKQKQVVLKVQIFHFNNFPNLETVHIKFHFSPY